MEEFYISPFQFVFIGSIVVRTLHKRPQPELQSCKHFTNPPSSFSQLQPPSLPPACMDEILFHLLYSKGVCTCQPTARAKHFIPDLGCCFLSTSVLLAPKPDASLFRVTVTLPSKEALAEHRLWGEGVSLSLWIKVLTARVSKEFEYGLGVYC